MGIELAVTTLALSAAASGCVIDTRVGPAGSDPVLVADIPETITNKVDLLFVVDNSEQMEKLQEQLVSSFNFLHRHLKQNEIGPPSIHVGVVSSDLGVRSFAGLVESCSYAGGDGRLVPALESEDPACATMTGDPFLYEYPEYADASGDPLTNFGRDIGPAFKCMATLGSSGCDYEQPLEAMETVLDHPYAEDRGFLRPDAVLAVVFVTNEDDCSVFRDDLFNPEDAMFSRATPDYRCFAYGVTCNGDDVSMAGRYEGCAPNPESRYVRDVTEFENTLMGIKHREDDKQLARLPARQKLVVAGVMGDASLVEVEVSVDGVPGLAPSCADDPAGFVAYPAVRLQSFVDRFDGGVVSPLCGEGRPLEPLVAPAGEIRRKLGTSCLVGDIADTDDWKPGIQPYCEVTRTRMGFDNIAPDGVYEAIPACNDPDAPGSSSALPCYTITPNQACGGMFQSNLSLNVYAENGLLGGGARKIGLEGERVAAHCIVRDATAE